MKRFFKLLGVFVFLLLLAAGIFVWWVASAAKEVPEFYRLAIERPPENVAAKTAALEAEVKDLTEQVQQVGQWEATFTADQINAWFVSDAPELGRALPPGTRDPRVFLKEDAVVIAARFKNERFDSVISIEIDARLSDQRNVVDLTINRVSAGALPIPVSRFQDRIEKAASRGRVEMQWREVDGNLVASIRIPENDTRYAQNPVIVETLELREGEIYLAGSSGLSSDQD